MKLGITPTFESDKMQTDLSMGCGNTGNCEPVPPSHHSVGTQSEDVDNTYLQANFCRSLGILRNSNTSMEQKYEFHIGEDKRNFAPKVAQCESEQVNNYNTFGEKRMGRVLRCPSCVGHCERKPFLCHSTQSIEVRPSTVGEGDPEKGS